MRRSAVVLHSIALAFACTFILLFLISSASAKNPPPLNRGLPDSVLVKDPKHPNGPKIFLAPPECTECTKIYNQLKTALESFYSLQYADAQETGTEGNVDAAGNSSAAKRALTALGTITSTTDTDGLNKVQNGAKPQDVKDFPKNAKGLEKTINDLIKALKDCEDNCNKKKAAANQPQTTPTEKPAEPPKKEEPKKEEPKKEETKKTEETTEWAKPPTEHPTTLIGWRGLQKQAKDEIANGSPYKSEWEKLLKEAETAIEKLNEEGGYYRPLQRPGTPSVSNVGFQGGTLTLPSAAASPGAGYVNVCSLYGSGFYYLPGTDTCVKIGGWNPAGTTLFVDGGISSLRSSFLLNSALSGSTGGVPIPLTSDPIAPGTTTAGATGFIFGGIVSWPFISLSPLAPPPPPPPPPAYAPEDKPASGFPAVLPTKAPPKQPAPLRPPVSFNLEAGIYGFAGGKSTINGIPGGPGITPTGADSFNFRDNFMVTAGAAVVVPVTASVTAAITGGFAGVDKTATFNCVTYCVNGVPVPAFSASKDVFLPGAYLGGRVQWPIAIPGFPGAAFFLQYKHVFVPSENLSLGSVAQGRIVSFNVSQDLDLVTAGLAIPLH